MINASGQPGEELLVETIVDGDPWTAHAVRRAVRAALKDDPCGEAAELVTSELLSNAQRHAAGTYVLRLTRRASYLLIEVEDQTEGGVEIGPPLETNVSDHGRGLRLVQALSTRFGVTERGADGKTVWAEVARR